MGCHVRGMTFSTSRPAPEISWAGAAHIRLAALAMLLMALTCTAQARITAADLVIPPELQALFVEAEGEFSVKTLANMPRPSPANFYWVDNHRVIYTVRSFNGWEARKDERSKIIIYDVDSGMAEETPYRGNLRCLGTDGQILVQDYALPSVDYLQPGDTEDDQGYFLSGRLGQELTRFKRPKEHGMLDYFSCRFYSNAAPEFGKGHLLTPLRPEDGSLDEAPDAHIRLVSTEGKTRWEVKTHSFCNPFLRPVYLPWLNRYFTSAAWSSSMLGCTAMRENSWLFSNSEIEVRPLPALIHELKKYGRLGGDGATYWAKPGMFVYAHASRGLNGLYWDDPVSGKLKRVLSKPWGLDDLSPDGCRNLVLVAPPVLIELCKGKT
jgi:hypothetical protein